MIGVFDSSNIKTLDISKIKFSKEWIDYIVEVVTNGPSYYCKNFCGTFKLLLVNQTVIPFAVLDNRHGNSHLTSFSNYYTSFAYDSIKHKTKSRYIRFLLRLIIKFAKIAFGMHHLDKALYLNFWLMPTPPRVVITEAEYKEILLFLNKEYPNHAILFRGYRNYFDITVEGDSLLAPTIISKIYYTIDNLSDAMQKKDVKKSLQKIKEDRYLIGGKNDVSDEDQLHILSLYNKLYVDKFSKHSLIYTKKWISLIKNNDLINFHIVRDKIERKIKSYIITFEEKDYIVSSIGAYDQNDTDSFNLYTLNFSNRFVEAMQKNKKLNLSSSADVFKKNRGGKPRWEYDLISVEHLNFFAKTRWFVFVFIYKRFGESFYKGIIN